MDGDIAASAERGVVLEVQETSASMRAVRYFLLPPSHHVITVEKKYSSQHSENAACQTDRRLLTHAAAPL